MQLDVCVNEVALLGPFEGVVKARITFDSEDKEEGLPTRRDDGPTRYESVPHWETWT